MIAAIVLSWTLALWLVAAGLLVGHVVKPSKVQLWVPVGVLILIGLLHSLGVA